MKNKVLILLFITLSFHQLNAQSLDLKILEHINGSVNPGPDRFWNAVSDQSYKIDIAVPLSLFTVGLIKHDQSLKVKAYETGVALIGAGGAAFILKKIVQRDRPATTYPGLIIPKVNETDYSFPSGHASFAFATATSLSLAFPKWYVIIPSFIYAGTVAYSRLYLGVHYPSDVIGGAIIGIASSYITYEAQKLLVARKHRHQHPDKFQF